MQPGRSERLLKRWPVSPPPALNLSELGDDLPVASVEEPLHGLALGLQTKPGDALLGSADAVVGNE